MKDEKIHDIKVLVDTYYVEAESDAEMSRFVFAYTINIENQGTVAAKLISRHWIVTDANSRVQEVTGKGVIGEQPRLEPGESFKYTSGTMIETPVGSMQGSFQMVTDDGESFDAEIAPFSLAIQSMLN